MAQVDNRWRLAGFSLITVLLFFGLLEGGISLLEEQGQISTHRRDDNVLYKSDILFKAHDDGWARTSTYAADALIPSKFRVDKKDAFRLFVVGGSFAMGSPYVQQSIPGEERGGMSAWIRARLSSHLSPRPVEVINAAAGGQNSHRVRSIVEELMEWEPDALFVATCNNEGSLAPSYISQSLHQSHGYRALTKFLVPEKSLEARSYYSPQDADSQAIKDAFHRNLRSMAEMTREREIPLFLATLPVNLFYTGHNSIHEVNPQSGEFDPEALIEDAQCVPRGMALFQSGKFDEAIAVLEKCVDISEAIRGIGFSHWQMGRHAEARAALEQSLELAPMNRCRPSYNQLIREIAGEYAHITLVDLDKTTREAGTHGMADPKLFLDYCHLTWQGYVQMADTFLQTLAAHDLLDGAFSATLSDEKRQILEGQLALDELDEELIRTTGHSL